LFHCFLRGLVTRASTCPSSLPRRVLRIAAGRKDAARAGVRPGSASFAVTRRLSLPLARFSGSGVAMSRRWAAGASREGQHYRSIVDEFESEVEEFLTG